MHSKVDWESFPPPGRYVQGMPIQTYESIMQGVSTRMQIFALSPTPVNQRSISTLTIESFFSELTNMEFSGLGCPKAVDIPRLISHVTELNNIHHKLDRGFSSTPLSRDKQGMVVWLYVGIYSNEDTMAHTRRLMVIS